MLHTEYANVRYINFYSVEGCMLISSLIYKTYQLGAGEIE